MHACVHVHVISVACLLAWCVTHNICVQVSERVRECMRACSPCDHFMME